MSNEIQLFNFDSKFQVRVIIRDNGEARYVASDICQAINIKNPQTVYQRLEEAEKGMDTIDTLGGTQEMITVNESGVYEIMFGSRTKRAKDFKKWLKSDVLPQIRRTGRYEPLSQKPMTDGERRIRRAQEWLEMEIQLDRQERELAKAEQQRKDMVKAIVETHDIAIDAKDTAAKAMHQATATQETLTNQTNWLSVMGYSRILGLNLSVLKLAPLGKAATKRAKEQGVEVQRVNDARFGMVNIYPREILEQMEPAFRLAAQK